MNVDEITKRVDDVQHKQIPFAMSQALNDTAFKVMEAERLEMRDVFDKPTPWLLRGLRVAKSTKHSLVATVGFDRDGNKTGVTGDKVLRAEVLGGARRLKGFEVALRRKGYLEPGEFAVPGKAAGDLNMIDSYGNMKGSAIVQILSKLQAFMEIGHTANVAGKRQRAAGRSRVFWVGKPGRNTPRGIWLIDEKYGGGRGRLRPIIVFVNSTNYEAVFDFGYVASKTVEHEIGPAFQRRLANALRTAR